MFKKYLIDLNSRVSSNICGSQPGGQELESKRTRIVSCSLLFEPSSLSEDDDELFFSII